MKPQILLLPIAAVLFSACGTPDTEGETAEAPKPAFTGNKVWNVGGMTIGSRTPAMDPISEEPIGPGALEAELAASPAEPMPEGTAPVLDANIMPDGNPGETTEPVPQSPFDPALQNPPAEAAPPAPDAGAVVPAPPPPPEAPAN
jgi:hypothetical protein